MRTVMRFRRSVTAAAIVAAAADGAPDYAELPWEAEMAFEGVDTSDYRRIAPGAMTWRDLPLPLMGLRQTTEGHSQAESCGRIESVSRDGSTIVGSGVFAANEFGALMATDVEAGNITGVSVDLAVLDYEFEPLEEPPPDATEEDLLDALWGPQRTVFLSCELLGATVLPMPAFGDAKIRVSALAAATDDAAPRMVATLHTRLELVGRLDVAEEGARLVRSSLATLAASSGVPIRFSVEADGEGVVETIPCGCAEDAADPAEGVLEGVSASAAGLAPEAPPAAWFADPLLEAETPFTVTDDGRVFGHIATWGTCHTGYRDRCVTPPQGGDDYSHFHLKQVVCDDGTRVDVGTLSIDGPHAPSGFSAAQTVAHYDNTTTAAADVCAGEDAYGIWIAGAVRPGLDAAKVRALLGATPSGDWRAIGGKLRLLGVLGVNVPGFPIPREKRLVASGVVRSVVAAREVPDGSLEAADPRVALAAAASLAGVDVLDAIAVRASALSRTTLE